MRFRELTEGSRPWRRYHVQEKGECWIVTEAGLATARFELGRVTTGRTQVFVGVFVRVKSPDQRVFLGEDPYSLVRAFRKADLALFTAGWLLDAIGSEPAFYQTGLTDGTAWGYLPNVGKAVHIFEPTPDHLGSR